MKVEQYIKLVKEILTPYQELDIDEDWSTQIEKRSLYNALRKTVENTKLHIKYYWDNDD